jgi:hypothetical protein
MRVLLANTHLHRWRNEGNAFLGSHFNGWRAMDAFVWLSAKTTECWMARPSVTEEENCTAQSWHSESHVCHVLQPKLACAWPSRSSWYHG